MHTKYYMPHFGDFRLCRVNSGPYCKEFSKAIMFLLLKNGLNTGKTRSLQGPGLGALSEKNCCPFPSYSSVSCAFACS